MRGALALVAPAVLALGCQAAPPLPRFGLSVSAEQIVKRVQAQRAAVRTVDGAARVYTDNPEKSGAFDADLVIERPRRFRQIGYAMGTEIFDLLLDGASLTVFNRDENVVIRHELGSGRRTPKSLSGVERFFANTPIARLLLGPGRFDEQEEWREMGRDDDMVRFGLFRGAKQVGTVLVENDTLVMREHRIAPARPGDADLSVRFGSWRKVETPAGPVWWPHAIEVESKSEEFFMSFAFDEVVINEPLPEDAFDQAIPEDAKER